MARRDKETLIWLISLILRRVRASTDSVELDGLCAFAIRGKGGRQGRVPVIFFEVLKSASRFCRWGDSILAQVGKANLLSGFQWQCSRSTLVEYGGRIFVIGGLSGII